jgi:hypothetical protein
MSLQVIEITLLSLSSDRPDKPDSDLALSVGSERPDLYIFRKAKPLSEMSDVSDGVSSP